MKTLLFFTSQFPFGSGETFIENEFPFLADAFDRVFIITNNLNDPQTRGLPDGVRVIRYPYQARTPFKIQALGDAFSPVLRNELKFVRQKPNLSLNKQVLSVLLGTYAKALETSNFLTRLVAEHHLDISDVWMYSYWMNNMAAGIAMFKVRHPEVKAFCRAHGWDVYFERHHPPYLPLRNFIVQNLNACFCISANGQQYVKALCDSNVAEKIRLSRLGTFNQRQLRSRSNNDKLVIVSCSNLIALKRIDLIIDSLALLDGFDIEWTHFGSGPLESEMKTLAAEKLYGLNHITCNFTGQLSNPELLSWYGTHSIDLFINVSETEGLPVSIMEACSFGIPVIATNVGGVSEVIEQGENGFLLKGDASAVQVSQQIEYFYRLSQTEKEKMRQKAFEIWNRKFNAQVNYAGFIDTLLAQ